MPHRIFVRPKDIFRSSPFVVLVWVAAICLFVVVPSVSKRPSMVIASAQETPLSSATTTLYLPSIAAPKVNVLANSGFELGTLFWTQFSTSGQPLIHSTSTLEIAPRRGQHAIRLGQYNDEVSMISQAVSIPPTRRCVVYWYWATSNDACNADYGGVGTNGNWAEEPLSLCAGTSTAQWVQRTVLLSETHITIPTTVINFAVINDYSAPSTLYIDDVAFENNEFCSNQVGAATETNPFTEETSKKLGRPIIESSKE